MKKKILIFSLAIVSILMLVFFLYCNNISNVNSSTINFYKDLKYTLSKRGYSISLLITSTKRSKWHNYFQVKFSGAAKESKHLVGDAIDFIIFDIDNNGKSDENDVDIVYEILDKEIIKDKGGIGTYKGETSFINRQMIHIDCRGNKARWAR